MHSLKKQGKGYASLQQKSRLRITPFWSLLQIRNSEFFKCELTAPRITAVNPAVLDRQENLKYRFWQHLHGFPLQRSYWGGYELPFCKMDNLRNVAILRKRTCRHYILLFCYCKASQFTKTKQKTRLGFTEMGKSKALLAGVSQQSSRKMQTGTAWWGALPLLTMYNTLKEKVRKDKKGAHGTPSD